MSYFWEKNETDGTPKITVLFWSPAGSLESSFGHISVVVTRFNQDISYTIAPGGCGAGPFERYAALQRFRDGYAFKLKLTDDQANKIANWMATHIIQDGKLPQARPTAKPDDGQILKFLPADSFVNRSMNIIYETGQTGYKITKFAFDYADDYAIIKINSLVRKSPTIHNFCEYSILTNNCVSPIKNAFKAANINVGENQLYPIGFINELRKSGMVDNTVKISGCFKSTYPYLTGKIYKNEHDWDTDKTIPSINNPASCENYKLNSTR